MSKTMIGKVLGARDRPSVGKTLGVLACALAAVASGGLVVIRPDLSVYLLGLTGAAGYLLLCLGWPLAAFSVLLFFALTVWLSGIEVMAGISAMIGLGLVFMTFWLTRLSLRTVNFVRIKEYRLLLALIAIVLISAILHLDGPAGFGGALTYLQLPLLLVLVVNLADTPKRLRALGEVVIVSSVLLAVLILLDYFEWLPAGLVREQIVNIAVMGGTTAVARTGGLWGDANFTAVQLNIALPFILARWPRTGARGQALLLAASGLILIAFVWTFSMGGLLGISVMLLVRMFSAPQRNRLFAVVRNSLMGGAAFASFMIFAPELYVERVMVNIASVAGIFGASDSYALLTFATHRGNNWWAALQAIMASPLLGYGPGNASYANAWYSVLPLSNQVGAHNMILDLAGDLGLIGMILFGALLIAALRAVRSTPSASAVEPELHRTRQAIFTALVGYVVQGMGLGIHNLKLLWILLGMAFAYRQLAARSPAAQSRGAP
jgi:O-antigen ligase